MEKKLTFIVAIIICLVIGAVLCSIGGNSIMAVFAIAIREGMTAYGLDISGAGSGAAYIAIGLFFTITAANLIPHVLKM